MRDPDFGTLPGVVTIFEGPTPPVLSEDAGYSWVPGSIRERKAVTVCAHEFEAVTGLRVPHGMRARVILEGRILEGDDGA